MADVAESLTSQRLRPAADFSDFGKVNLVKKIRRSRLAKKSIWMWLSERA